ncbi:MAG TPA: S41 family peptidase [Chthonomonadaceae bacterium]|nr:S41 family peptidase [Chthonomonadaceae bacterium]
MKPSGGARILLTPFVLSLIFASIIVGYASADLFPGAKARSGGAGRVSQIAQGSDTDSDDPGSARQGVSGGGASDPLAAYKDALELLRQNYYGAPIDTKMSRQLTYEAIRGMLGSLQDPFTSFLAPEEWQDMEAMTEGDFDGIGAILQQEGTTLRIVHPIDGSPAERAGLKAEDVVIAVNGKIIKGKNINDVVHLIKGPPNTRVRLTVQRGKQTVELTILRARVETPVVQHWMEDAQARIGHIVLSEFNKKSMAQLNAAFTDLDRQGMKAIVLDLRFNPGGLLETAVDVTSMFVPTGTRTDLKNNVIIMRYGDSHEEGAALRPLEHKYGDRPLVVLVNGSSASASEIVTGAIQDYGVGTILGERTFGKGEVQTLYEMSQGLDGALKLTTALYYPPSHRDINYHRDEDGNRIEKTGGILPDIEIGASEAWKLKEDFKDKANDNQLQAALAFLRARLDHKSVAEATEAAKKFQPTVTASASSSGSLPPPRLLP